MYFLVRHLVNLFVTTAEQSTDVNLGMVVLSFHISPLFHIAGMKWYSLPVPVLWQKISIFSFALQTGTIIMGSVICCIGLYCMYHPYFGSGRSYSSLKKRLARTSLSHLIFNVKIIFFI